MNSWRTAAEKWLNENDENDGLLKVAPPGNTLEQVSEVEAVLGVKFPEPMRELYLAVDGFDFCSAATDEPEFVKRLKAIPEYAEQERGYLAETHADFAKGYLPFIDFGNGDSCGYTWITVDGAKLPMLVIVEHAHFQYDAKQPVAEFVREMPDLQDMFPSK